MHEAAERMRWTRKLGPLQSCRTNHLRRPRIKKDVLINAANERWPAHGCRTQGGARARRPSRKELDNAVRGAPSRGPASSFANRLMVLLQACGKALRDLCARARPDDFGAGSAVATAAPGLPFETLVRGGAAPGVPVGERTCSAPRRLAFGGRDVATPPRRGGAMATNAGAPPPPCRRRRGVGTRPPHGPGVDAHVRRGAQSCLFKEHGPVTPAGVMPACAAARMIGEARVFEAPAARASAPSLVEATVARDFAALFAVARLLSSSASMYVNRRRSRSRRGTQSFGLVQVFNAVLQATLLLVM